MTISYAVAGEVPPQVPGAGLVHIGDLFLNGITLIDHAFVVVSALFAAIADLPGLLGVIAGDGSIRPNVSIARDFPAVIKVVEDAELARQRMLVRSDLLTVHD